MEGDQRSIETGPRSVRSLTFVNYPVYLAIMTRNVNDLLRTHHISRPRKLESHNSCSGRARLHRKSDIKQNSIYLTSLPNKQNGIKTASLSKIHHFSTIFFADIEVYKYIDSILVNSTNETKAGLLRPQRRRGRLTPRSSAAANLPTTTQENCHLYR